MIKLGRLFKQKAELANSATKFYNCIAHLLDLITGEFFKDC